ncbi:response regulator transcription factor [Xanthocytophaga flava]|uniref:response regulator transcription factor n=1 Tax=Xanthocytophaga flava TaxID=3048013 RepID=UPI0028D22EFA|nr:response regulator transcription factor [Xanthocytophaga flavus]MDJ1472936.1 response regulator transcription factor [Xanthocytophaga flavus]
MKICLADDHPILIDSLVGLLESTGIHQVVGKAYHGEELLQLLPVVKPDIVIVDINMPGMNGITCSKWIKKNYPSIKIVILTMYNSRSLINQLVEIGIDGCLLKSGNSQELLNAIDRLQINKSYFDTIGDFKAEVRMEAEPDSHAFRLSDREIEIVRLIALGSTSSAISEKLFISEHTVKTHRKNIFKKLDISNVSQLTRYAMELGILS